MLTIKEGKRRQEKSFLIYLKYLMGFNMDQSSSTTKSWPYFPQLSVTLVPCGNLMLSGPEGNVIGKLTQ
jgi:hypothetical protein